MASSFFSPVGAADLDSGSSYNIHNDYSWTLNTGTIRDYVPKITLKEYKLSQSGELSSFLNNLAATSESTAGTAVRAAGAGAIVAALLGRSRGTGAAIGAGVGLLGGAGLQQLGSLAGVGPLKPYQGLYPAAKTNNIYYLPYLNVENMSDAAGSAGGWRSVEETISKNLAQVGKAGLVATTGKLAGQLSNIIGAVNQAGEAARQLEFAIGSPGAAVEKIKAFAPKDEGDTINVVFYLSNTTKKEDIQKNWNFLYKLTYQNLPNRRSTNLLDPPCVYDVEVQGFKRFPIAVIESLKITNEGTTRLVDITTGEITNTEGNNSNVKLIPEAFKVSISIRSLLMNTRNLFSYSYDKKLYQNINVFSRSS